ncbi:MAG: radical SAM protein [Candidatus Omnitrophica bacterium]|nr:radical SAM protein [Candidatus Omnitrophota bacterium]
MDIYESYWCCRLCPRECKVNRARDVRGVCGETATLRIAHLGPHFGEEPSFSGTRGSGTIFFSGCSSHCFFCQNYQISNQHQGREYTPEKLLQEVEALVRNEVHNLNFVTPDHFWPHIKGLCRRLDQQGIKIPKIFNSSGYQKAEMVEEYGEFMDMFMPDFKFSQPELAKTCMGDERYPGIALEAIRRMVKLKGFLDPWDPSGEVPARRGVLIRHLVLPGHVENSLEVLRLIRREFGPEIPISVMSQYRPVSACSRHGEFQRVLKAKEYEQVLELVGKLGFSKVYVQELVEQTAFLPDFNDPEDPFPGHRPSRL